MEQRTYSKRQAQAAATQELLLQCAHTVFAERGYQGTTVGAITKAANTAHGTFYLYFRNKDDAFAKVIEKVTLDVYDRALSQVYGADPPDIVRTEPTAERILVAVAEGEGATLVVEEQAATLRHPGVTFRRFAEPEPTVALAVAFPRRPPLAARRFVELAQEIAREPREGARPRI